MLPTKRTILYEVFDELCVCFGELKSFQFGILQEFCRVMIIEFSLSSRNIDAMNIYPLSKSFNAFLNHKWFTVFVE